MNRVMPPTLNTFSRRAFNTSCWRPARSKSEPPSRACGHIAGGVRRLEPDNRGQNGHGLYLNLHRVMWVVNYLVDTHLHTVWRDGLNEGDEHIKVNQNILVYRDSQRLVDSFHRQRGATTGITLQIAC